MEFINKQSEGMKKMMMLIVFVGLALFSAQAQSDAKAKAILDKVSAKTKAYSSITADFSFTMSNSAAGINETNTGNIALSKNKYKVNLNGIEILSNGKTQWTYMKDANEVSISASESDPNALNPAEIFTIYEKGFKNTYAGEVAQGGKKLAKIELIPTTKRDFSKVMLLIDTSNSQIVSATMTGNDGNTYTIKVSSMDTSKKYSDSTFEFNKSKYPGVHVIDMR
jgi:outer membrane lipoprotein-sorting protein